jgi:hypothetical protein
MSDERARVGRRAFIALGAGAIGGCVQGGTPGGGKTGQATDTQSESSPPTADSTTGTERTRTEPTTDRSETDSPATEDGNVTIGIDSERSEPQATATVGNGTTGDEDGITVWNDADTARRISVTVEKKAASGEPLLRETYQFEPDAYITVDVLEAGEYTITVGLDGEESKTVDFSVDDCNDQSLYVTVADDGTIRSSGMSTMAMCATI